MKTEFTDIEVGVLRKYLRHIGYHKVTNNNNVSVECDGSLRRMLVVPCEEISEEVKKQALKQDREIWLAVFDDAL